MKKLSTRPTELVGDASRGCLALARRIWRALLLLVLKSRSASSDTLNLVLTADDHHLAHPTSPCTPHSGSPPPLRPARTNPSFVSSESVYGPPVRIPRFPTRTLNTDPHTLNSPRTPTPAPCSPCRVQGIVLLVPRKVPGIYDASSYLSSHTSERRTVGRTGY